jgi:hypothetical protein
VIRACVLLCALASAMACATVASFRVPEGPWTPDPSAPGIFEGASASCRGVRTLTAEIGVRGQAGPSKVRGRVIAGFERGGALRLEAPAPFGAPIFILVARANRAVLWLPRDRRVLRDAPVEDVLEAIAGLRRSSDDLLALVSGCLTSASTPEGAGQRSSRGWIMVDLADATRAFLTRDGQAWRISAGRRDAADALGSWSVSYADFSLHFPGSIRIWQDVGPPGQPGSSAALTLQVSQLETNVPIDSRAFELVVPPDAAPLTIDELRQSGPLADRAAGQENAR